MRELFSSLVAVAKYLDMPLFMVNRWIAKDGNQWQEMVPESCLRQLKYVLVSEHRGQHGAGNR
jgi:hypothetical protein